VLVVADSSPLIYLSRIGILHVLAALFGEVVVPRAVWNEAVERLRPTLTCCDKRRGSAWSMILPLPRISDWIPERQQPFWSLSLFTRICCSSTNVSAEGSRNSAA
jgi:hypothetical protein